MQLGGQLHAPVALLPAKNTDAHWEEAGCAPDQVWTIRKRDNSLTPAEIRTPNRPARNVVPTLTAIRVISPSAYHATSVHEEVEVHVHPFLTSKLIGAEQDAESVWTSWTKIETPPCMQSHRHYPVAQSTR